MKTKKRFMLHRRSLPPITASDWCIIAGAFVFWSGFIVGLVALISIGTTRYPNYFVNAGRSSFLEMLVGLHYPPFLAYSIAVMLTGAVLAGAGFLIKHHPGQVPGQTRPGHEEERQPNQAL
jgi:hypothetical protein